MMLKSNFAKHLQHLASAHLIDPEIHLFMVYKGGVIGPE